MKIGSHELKLEKRVTLSGWEAALISILAIFFALALFSLLFLLAGINPLVAYQKIFSYAFANPFGLPLTINRAIFILFCTCAFIIPFRAEGGRAPGPRGRGRRRPGVVPSLRRGLL